MKLNKNFFKENIKTIIYALLIAVFIRSIFFQPFYIPSSSMEPNLLVGDRLFVSKYTYGYSKHSFPFSPPILNKRIFYSEPKYGDLIVFKTPSDNRTDFIKRLIGLPGDEIQFIDGDLYINNNQVIKTKIKNFNAKFNCGNINSNCEAYIEKLPSGVTYVTIYNQQDTRWNDSDKYKVPKDHYFFLGDNRDNSGDSRYLGKVGYVNKLNLVGRARRIFFSSDKKKGNFFKFWKWHKSIRIGRFFNKIQ